MFGLLTFIGSKFAAEGGIATLGVDGKALILQIITFLIVYWLLKRFALSKIIAALEQRRETIDKGVTLGREMEAEKADLEQKVQARLREARKEADKILASAHQEAGELLKDAEATASRKAEQIVNEAHARIDDELKKARKGLEQDMLDLVAEATEVIIDEKLDAKKDQSLINKALSEVRTK